VCDAYYRVRVVSKPTPAAPLTPELAQEIAGEISRIIGLNVLITDRDAVVIGSGDIARVGSVHEASVAVLHDLQPAWHSAAQARELSGVRAGMTLPILLDGAAVGTVGLTGPPRRVRPFGLVVQRQTEILLREAIVMRSRMLRDRALSDLFREIALYEQDTTDAEALAERARELGLIPRLPRAVLLVDVAAPDSVAPPEPYAAVVRTVRDAFHHPQDVVGELTAGRIGVLHHLADGRAPDGELRERCTRLVAQLRRSHHASARIGVGEQADRLSALHDSYTDAAAALRLGPLFQNGDSAVFSISDLRGHQLVAETNLRARDRLRTTVLSPLRGQSDWPVVRETLIAWAESGFNLVGAAGELRIHRNSLLHRLNKISNRTGRSAREPRHGLTLYLAALADQLDEQSRGPQDSTRIWNG
jgi:carbohydrate diacid regulator